jgi:hypothetical protein
VAQPARGGTALARVSTDGTSSRSRFVDDGSTIPTVAFDESTSGLSADGRTLVLASPWMMLGQQRTRFDLFDARSLKPRETISVPGSYSFDAISPDGNLLYLIRYTSPADPSRYQVRAYDVPSGRLLANPVVDPHEAGEPMTGKPVTRVMSPSGQWAYTLYRGADEGPFVHALDTSHRRAVCVDLVGIDLPRHLSGTQLSVSDGGEQLTLVRHGRELGQIDTTTFEVTPPALASGDDGPPWGLIVALSLVALLAAGITSGTIHRRRRLASS